MLEKKGYLESTRCLHEGNNSTVGMRIHGNIGIQKHILSLWLTSKCVVVWTLNQHCSILHSSQFSVRFNPLNLPLNITLSDTKSSSSSVGIRGESFLPTKRRSSRPSWFSGILYFLTNSSSALYTSAATRNYQMILVLKTNTFLLSRKAVIV